MQLDNHECTYYCCGNTHVEIIWCSEQENGTEEWGQFVQNYLRDTGREFVRLSVARETDKAAWLQKNPYVSIAYENGGICIDYPTSQDTLDNFYGYIVEYIYS